MVHTQIGDNLHDIRIVENGEWGRELIFKVSCHHCGKIFERYTYEQHRLYTCDECKEKQQKKAQAETKAKKKALEEKVLKRFMPSVKKAKKDMCEHFCIIPRMFSDEQIQKEACTNCPFLLIEGSME